MSLDKKIDFAIIFSVKNANPNGDPLNGNRPRADYNGVGEVSDVCLKRKIRDRLQEEGFSIFVQSDEKKIDGMTSLKSRAESEDFGLGKDAWKFEKKDENLSKKKDETRERACAKWMDVRSFGQVFAFSSKKDDADGVSIPVRGPVTIQNAYSVEPIVTNDKQIVKSVDSEDEAGKKARMGMKYSVKDSVYVTFGAMTPQLAERTGFSDDDALAIKKVLPKLFEGDASSARPEGSMQVLKVIWWQHSSKAGQHSSAKVHGTLHVNSDGTYSLDTLEGLLPEEIDGF